MTFATGTNINTTLTSERSTFIWVSGNENSAAAITFPGITGKTLTVISAFDQDDGDSITATISGNIVTLDAAGGATNSTYVVHYMYV